MSDVGKVAWIAVDWGTTNLRLWALDHADTILAYRSSDKGMSRLARDAFEPALLELAEDLLPAGTKTPVVVCGMAGSRQGWFEAPYKTVPCAPPTLDDATPARACDDRLNVHILPGVKQLNPADVMRGEETQIAGFLVQEPDYKGLLCLPGTHTKWAFLDKGTINGFRTLMTGELFALLSDQSVLRFGLSEKEIDRSAFRSGVREAFENPATFAAALFGIRAAGLVDGLPPEAGRGRLSGLLIGMELAAVKAHLTDQPIAILGNSSLAETYRDALESLGHNARLLDADTTTLKGLTLAYKRYAEVTS